MVSSSWISHHMHGIGGPTILRAALRIVALVLLALFLTMLVGHGRPAAGLEAVRHEPAMTLLLSIACAGLLVAWGFEGTGGAMTAGAMSLFVGAEWIGHGQPPGGPVFPLMLAVGVLFVALSVWDHRRSAGRTGEGP